MDKLPEANNIINEMAQIDEDLKRYRENIKSHQENLDKTDNTRTKRAIEELIDRVNKKIEDLEGEKEKLLKSFERLYKTSGGKKSRRKKSRKGKSIKKSRRTRRRP